MLKTPILYLKRFTVFIPGIIIAAVSFKYTFPFFDKRLSDVPAILITYVIAAYFLIPLIIRAFRLFWPAYHLPLYCVTPDGFASDPLNIGIVGSRLNLIESMEKAGWYTADQHSFANYARQILGIVFQREYANGPVSSLYLFGRKQDVAFEIPVNGSGHHRHHVRFWATTFNDSAKLNVRSIDWHQRRAHGQEGDLLWVGAASLDIGITPIRHNMQLTHMVHPDTNSERDLIVEGLSNQELINKSKDLKLGDPYKLVNRTWRGELHTDGNMKLVWLKPIKISK
jgi:hypothetical protein